MVCVAVHLVGAAEMDQDRHHFVECGFPDILDTVLQDFADDAHDGIAVAHAQ